MIALGASGVNIEDGSDIGGPHLVDVELHCDRIRAACEAARKSGVDIVVNARTDSYWLKLGDDDERLKVSIERANRYREAGAHCLFVPGPADAALIGTLVKEIAGPLNILAVPGLPERGRAAGARRAPPQPGLGADARLDDAHPADRPRPDRQRHLRPLPPRCDPVSGSERPVRRQGSRSRP